MPIGAEPPGAEEQATTASYLEGFNTYFGAGPELEGRLNDVLGGIDASTGADTGHDDTYWDHGSNKGHKSESHFKDHWIGGRYWDDEEGEGLYSKLRTGVRDAAEKATNGGKVKPLRVVLDRGSSLAVAVADGADAVTITISTPARQKP